MIRYVYVIVVAVGLAFPAVSVAGLSPAGGKTQGTAPPLSVRVEDAWVRTPAPSGGVTGGYLTIVNESGTPLRLVGASSPRATTIELHEMTMDGDVMRMRPVKEIVVPARGRTTLAPGGLHLMVFGLSATSTANAKIPLTLMFAGGQSVTVEATVRAGEGHHH